tara:strand:- start:83 stop:370 length:288 start_codon:yes stop_codon:yes gene_type:complete
MNKIIMILKGTLFGILSMCVIDLAWFSDKTAGYSIPEKDIWNGSSLIEGTEVLLNYDIDNIKLYVYFALTLSFILLVMSSYKSDSKGSDEKSKDN